MHTRIGVEDVLELNDALTVDHNQLKPNQVAPPPHQRLTTRRTRWFARRLTAQLTIGLDQREPQRQQVRGSDGELGTHWRVTEHTGPKRGRVRTRKMSLDFLVDHPDLRQGCKLITNVRRVEHVVTYLSVAPVHYHGQHTRYHGRLGGPSRIASSAHTRLVLRRARIGAVLDEARVAELLVDRSL